MSLGRAVSSCYEGMRSMQNFACSSLLKPCPQQFNVSAIRAADCRKKTAALQHREHALLRCACRILVLLHAIHIALLLLQRDDYKSRGYVRNTLNHLVSIAGAGGEER